MSTPTNCWSRLLCWLLGHDPCCHIPPEGRFQKPSRWEK